MTVGRACRLVVDFIFALTYRIKFYSVTDFIKIAFVASEHKIMITNTVIRTEKR